MNNPKEIDLSLILPLYNEGLILNKSLSQIFHVLDQSNLNYEIILIDDKSQDETVVLVERVVSGRDNCILYKHQFNLGRGGTVSEGFKKAQGRVVGFIDVDLEVGPGYIPEFVKRINNNEADGIIGLRKYKVGFLTLLRFFSSRVYQLLVKIFLGLPFRDTESGYKFFNREKILPIIDKIEDKGWFWDTEIMAWSHADGLKIIELPVSFKKNLKKKSTVNVFKDSIDYMVKLIKFKFKVKR